MVERADEESPRLFERDIERLSVTVRRDLLPFGAEHGSKYLPNDALVGVEHEAVTKRPRRQEARQGRFALEVRRQHAGHVLSTPLRVHVCKLKAGRGDRDGTQTDPLALGHHRLVVTASKQKNGTP